jgi:phosphatidylglycerophosphate synthase
MHDRGLASDLSDTRAGAPEGRAAARTLRPPTPPPREIQDREEDRQRLDAAVKADDGFFTTFFVSPYSKYVARWAARAGLTPNLVTAVSMAIGVGAAAAFATGSRGGLIGGAVLLQVAFTLDCVDGQLARYTGTFSRVGAWLDAVSDRATEYVVFAGLAIGATHGFDDHVWALAAAALALQTARHMLDFSFVPPRAPATGASSAETASPAGGAAHRWLRVARDLDSRRWTLWLRRVIAFPIGERLAVISLTAAVFTPRATFVVLLAWGAVAAVYTTGGRVLRSVAA